MTARPTVQRPSRKQNQEMIEMESIWKGDGKKARRNSLLAALFVASMLLCMMLPQSAASQPSMVPPIAIYGHVYADDGTTPVKGAMVRGTNPVTNETYTNFTGNDGSYVFAFYKYANDDSVVITVSYRGKTTSANTTLNYTTQPQEQIDFSLSWVEGDDGEDDDIEDSLPLIVGAMIIIVIVIVLLVFLMKRRKDRDEDEVPKQDKKGDGKNSG